MDWLIGVYNFLYFILPLAMIFPIISGCLKAIISGISARRLLGVVASGLGFAVLIYHWQIGSPLIRVDGELSLPLILISIILFWGATVLFLETLHPGILAHMERFPQKRNSNSKEGE